MAKITREQAQRLVAVIEEIQACEDVDTNLDSALSVTRQAIVPWYDYRRPASPDDELRASA